MSSDPPGGWGWPSTPTCRCRQQVPLTRELWNTGPVKRWVVSVAVVLSLAGCTTAANEPPSASPTTAPTTTPQLELEPLDLPALNRYLKLFTPAAFEQLKITGYAIEADDPLNALLVNLEELLGDKFDECETSPSSRLCQEYESKMYYLKLTIACVLPKVSENPQTAMRQTWLGEHGPEGLFRKTNDPGRFARIYVREIEEFAYALCPTVAEESGTLREWVMSRFP